MADSTLSGLKAFIHAHLQPGMTVIDIGANEGEITSAAAEVVGRTGRVIAYEPSPVSALTLSRRFTLRPQVDVRQIALSDRAGHANFYVDLTKSTSSTLYEGAIGGDATVIAVAVQTLDNEMAILPPVDFIKVDAQGAEARIFEAGRRLLKRDKPLLILEVWPDGLRAAGSNPTVLLDRLAGLGYHFHPVNAKGALGHPGKIRALIAGETRSSAMNVLAHPRRWPARRWHATAKAAPCLISLSHRRLCSSWLPAMSDPAQTT